MARGEAQFCSRGYKDVNHNGRTVHQLIPSYLLQEKKSASVRTMKAHEKVQA
jgi:hypothetical protein